MWAAQRYKSTFAEEDEIQGQILKILQKKSWLEPESLDSQSQFYKMNPCSLLFLSYGNKLLSYIFVGTKWCDSMQYGMINHGN